MTKNPEPEDVEVVKPYRDHDGHRWTDEEEGEGVRVYLVTKEGRALNVFAADRDAGRKILRDFLRAE